MELFLKKISNLDYMYISKEFQMFIRDTSDYKTLVKVLNNTEESNAELIIKSFPRFLREDLPGNIEAQYIESEAAFGVSLNSLYQFRSQCTSCVENFDYFESDLITFLGDLKEIGTVFTSKTSDQGNRENFFNPYVILLDWVTAEILDLESILEAIETRKKYSQIMSKNENKLENSRKALTKIQSGKKSFSQMFSKKSKEDLCSKSMKEVEIFEAGLESVRKCHKIISLRLINKEIPMFKLAKLETYKHIMKIFATASIQELTVLVQQAQGLESFIDSS